MGKRNLFLGSILLFLLLISSQTWAIPTLQLYSPGSTYDSSSETWIIDSNNFDLWVVIANNNIDGLMLSAAVPDNESGSITIKNGTSTISGSFSSNSTPITGNGTPLQPHGIFPSDYYLYTLGDFDVSSSTQVYDYSPGNFDTGDSTANGYIIDLSISISGYSSVHFDAFDHVICNNNVKYKFAPFSHDAEGNPVPEPATMLLLGSGLIGLGAFGRKKIRKNQ
jgi:hypothetical protein